MQRQEGAVPSRRHRGIKATKEARKVREDTEEETDLTQREGA